MRFYGRGVRATTISNNHGGLTTFSDCATRSLGDYNQAILDEVAVEGLDGITMQALWIRLKARTDFDMPLETELQKDWVFSVLLERARQCNGEESPDVLFYRLVKPRTPLTVYNRYDHTDGELGVVVEPDNIPEDPYPFKAYEDKVNGI